MIAESKYSYNVMIPSIKKRIFVSDSKTLSGLSSSIFFHIIMLILLIVELPSLKKDLNVEHAIVIDVVPIAELTNVRVKQSDRKDDTQQQTKKAPKSVEMVKQEINPEKSKKSAADEEAEKIPDKKAKDKQEDKKKPEDEQIKKKKDDDFARNIMKSLEEEKKKKQDKKIDKAFKEMADSLKGETNKEYNPEIPLSISEIDAVKSQITRKWNIAGFSGASDAKDIRVTVVIKIDMDGNVISLKPKLENHKSHYYKQFVESTERAIKAASPLQNLNKEKYHTWKEIEFTFDASGSIY